MDSTASSSSASAPRRARHVAAERVASVDRHISAGLDVRTACRRAAVSVPSYYRWRARERGGVGQTERIREMILSAAKTVFLRDGYGASLESIAEAAEVARHPDGLALQRIAMGEYRDTPTLMKVVHTLRTSHAIPALTEYLADYLRG